MKSLITSVLTFLVILSSTQGFSQETEEGYSITWKNGDVTLLKDLGNVDLHLKNGKTIRNVRIHRINEEKEKIEYEKNRTMHDLHFRDFKNAQAGEYSISILYLDESKKLSITENTEIYQGTGQTNFPVSYTGKKNKQQPICKADTIPTSQSLVFGANDTLVKSGVVIPVTLIEISKDLIRYKRRDLPDGPLYIISRKHETQIHQYNSYVKIYLNK